MANTPLLGILFRSEGIRENRDEFSELPGLLTASNSIASVRIRLTIFTWFIKRRGEIWFQSLYNVSRLQFVYSGGLPIVILEFLLCSLARNLHTRSS